MGCPKRNRVVGRAWRSEHVSERELGLDTGGRVGGEGLGETLCELLESGNHGWQSERVMGGRKEREEEKIEGD